MHSRFRPHFSRAIPIGVIGLALVGGCAESTPIETSVDVAISLPPSSAPDPAVPPIESTSSTTTTTVISTTAPHATQATLAPVETFAPEPVPLDAVYSTSGEMSFADSGQSLGNSPSWAVVVGDLDGDRDLDAVVANESGSRAWFNNGSAVFSANEQDLGSMSRADLADLDSDGDLDVFAVGRHTRVWFNNGSGRFSEAAINGQECSGVALGDIDGDGDVDAFISRMDMPNQVWLNDGSGGFEQSDHAVGSSGNIAEYSLDVELADLDGDGDLDVFDVNYNGFHRVWLNDGPGTFTNSGQEINVGQHSHGIALGDLDDDGDPDAFVSVADSSAFQVWLNDGTGFFSNSAQDQRELAAAQAVALGDLDGDGDLDAFMAHTGSSDDGSENTVWLNDGTGRFSDSGLRLRHEYSLDVALADLDGDGDPDALVANATFRNTSVDMSNRVWLGEW